jgi:hypothetical protein
MWTPKDQLVKLKNEDKHRYSARIIAASKPAFDKKKMSRYWIEFWGKKYVTLALVATSSLGHVYDMPKTSLLHRKNILVLDKNITNTA